MDPNHVTTVESKEKIAGQCNRVVPFLQAIIFRGTTSPPTCNAHFPPGWGLQVYVTAFAVTNFFVPLAFLTFCYGAICAAIWDNFNSKTAGRSREDGGGGDGDGEESEAVGRFRKRVRTLKNRMAR